MNLAQMLSDNGLKPIIYEKCDQRIKAYATKVSEGTPHSPAEILQFSTVPSFANGRVATDRP
jgi:hypothetical protein